MKNDRYTIKYTIDGKVKYKSYDADDLDEAVDLWRKDVGPKAVFWSYHFR